MIEKVLSIIGIAILIVFHIAIQIAIINNLNDISVVLKDRNRIDNNGKAGT